MSCFGMQMYPCSLLQLGDSDRGTAKGLRQILGDEDDGGKGSGDRASALA